MKRLLVRSLVAVLVAAPLAGLAQASVEEVRLQVKGLACPFCTYGIEKNIKKLPGVGSVETTIRTGVMRVTIAPGAALDVEGFRAAVSRSGFTLEHMDVTVTGRLVQHDGRRAIETEPGGQLFVLVEPGDRDAPEDLTPETLAKLDAAFPKGVLTVNGRLHVQEGQPPVLSVDSLGTGR